ncbi:hypothetical protein DOTSEDRAFT_73813 [Dothistroma septosporum NZE10]|uniref:AB hydrolase-1 domain-containing protein n=1 Tax=Dothistroma septosporum (strain NZE10 / CBS 128990) TaxID=675120 RepID=N1PGK7_DOTSN|nr:hypothetical protein DOTSEDRAFT_73813 [Dothistroma septosporum NZE10]
MTATRWRVKSHIVPAAFVRGTARGARKGSTPLRLAVKQYVRHDRTPCQAPALTLIVAHGIGGNKESFEPWFDELAECGAPIDAIWMIDAAHNGGSHLLNEGSLGDDIDWLDYSRDIFQVINYFQAEMQQPLVGIGHSLGAGVISYLAAWHPRLFSGIAMLEPGMGPGKHFNWPPPLKFYPGLLAIQKTDSWPSLQQATEELCSSRMYKDYDPRAFQRILKHELRPMTPRDANFGVWENGVALVTPKEVEVNMWIVPDPPLRGFGRRQDLDYPAAETTIMPGIRRPESFQMRESLAQLCCPVLYVWATRSMLNHKRRQQIYLDDTAIGWSERNGNITAQTVHAGHMLAQENPAGTAAALSEWLQDLHKREQDVSLRVAKEPPFVRGVHPAMRERFSNL